MRKTRLYHPEPLPDQGEITLTDQAARHAATVLRARAGDSVELFDGQRAMAGEITMANKREVRVRLSDPAESPAPSPLRSVLVQGVARGEKMDWLMQKATELGISAIQPVIMQRTQQRMDAEKRDKRRQRWQQQVISACEQCHRIDVPEVAEPLSLELWLQSLPEQPWLIYGDPAGGQSIGQLPAPGQQTAYIVVGPEGGFAPEERQLLAKHQAHAVTLGPRVLRTETAGMTMLTVMQYLWGDLG